MVNETYQSKTLLPLVDTSDATDIVTFNSNKKTTEKRKPVGNDQVCPAALFIEVIREVINYPPIAIIASIVFEFCFLSNKHRLLGNGTNLD